MGGLYLYNILQCPMEAVHGRQSAWHNVASAGMLGYIGVATGRLGIPFVGGSSSASSFFYKYPFVSPPMVGAGVYGAIGFVFAAVLGGKPL